MDFTNIFMYTALKREQGHVTIELCGKDGLKGIITPKTLWSSYGNQGTYPHGHRYDKYICHTMFSYTPLISFTISSISARKAGFCAMRFSMVSMEEITVEWSRPRIFPMLGRDISVT